MNNALGFIIFISIFLSIFFALHFYLYLRVKHFFSLSSKWWYFVVFALSINFPLVAFLERSYPSLITITLYILSTIWMGMLVIFVTVFTIAHLIGIFLKLPYSKKQIGSVLISIALILSTYALINSRFIKVKTIELPIANLQEETRIVHLSDLHLGVMNKEKFLKKVVEKTNSLNPDIIMITGDLFDSSDSLKSNTLFWLSKFNAKTYFSIGNHEIYESTEKIEKLLENSSIETLRNSVVEYKNIQIIGVDNPEGHSRKNETQKDIIQSFDLDKNKPAIMMYHLPIDYLVAKEVGVNLQLSGHTHYGQIFPFTLAVKLFYPKIKGLYKFDDNFSLYVSPGTGTWGPPMRLGSSNEITLLVLKPKR